MSKLFDLAFLSDDAFLTLVAEVKANLSGPSMTLVLDPLLFLHPGPPPL